MSDDNVLIELHFGGKIELDKVHLNYSGGNQKNLYVSNSLTYKSLTERVLEEADLMQDEPLHIQCLMQEACHNQCLHQNDRTVTLMSIENDNDIYVMFKAHESGKNAVRIYASQGSVSKEEHFQAFFRKIESVVALENNLKDRVKRVKESLMSSTIALSTGKEMENGVLEELAESIRKIDDLSESCESNKSHEIIDACIQKIEYRMALFKEGKILLDKKNNGVNGPQHVEPVPERWLTKAEEKVKGNLPVTYPKMRYNDLEPPLRRCLLFLSVFPKDAVIKKKTIIYWWLGEGLVKPNKAQTAEQAGQQCFKMLLLNGLIVPILKNHDKEARCCKLDSSVRQMLNSKVEEAGLCFKTYSNNILTGVKGEHPLSCLTATENEQSVMVSLEHKNSELLSLFNISAQYLVCDCEKFRTFRLIKVLQLGRWQISSNHHIEVSDTKFLESLGVMKNLRYLSLQGISRITMLPESLVNLTNLQILDLRACHNLETLPTGIAMLKNLTHLDASECSLLDRMPKGLASLSELQVLKGFIISERRIHDSCRLKDLSGLKKLRKLSINIAKGANANDDLNELKRFTALKSLTITWGKVTETQSDSSLEILLSELEKLDLRCIPKHEKLNWLKPEGFPNLKKLYVRGGQLASLNLGTTSMTWNVETLRLKFLSELKWNKWSEIENAFPSLACIEIYNCPELKAKPESLPPFLDVDGVWIKNNEASSSDIASSSSSRGKMD